MSDQVEDIATADEDIETADEDIEIADEVPAGGVTAHDLGIELPDDPHDRERILLDEVAAARAEAASYLDDLRRVAADFDNYRKRAQRELASNIERASQRVVANLLPVLDSLELAIAHEAQSESEVKLLGGVRTTYEQLLDVLGKEGLEPIESLGEPFDPEHHQAVASTATGHDLIVTSEMRRGYRLNGRLIRAAMVSVGDDE